MTEKVVSLSSGLVLGMAFALFLGIGATQISSSPLHMEYPALPDLLGLNDYQSFHTPSSASPAQDTTPSISVSPPPAQGTGRIVRIATVSETTNPILASASSTATEEEFTPKNWADSEDPKAGSTLQQMHLQHSYIAGAANTYDHISLGQIARQTNFTCIAFTNSGNANQASGGSDQPPSNVDSKPGITGTPAIAQGDPEITEGEESEEGGEGSESGPAVASYTPRPSLPDNDLASGRNHVQIDPYNPHGYHSYTAIDPRPDAHHNDPHGSEAEYQQNHHKPETD